MYLSLPWFFFLALSFLHHLFLNVFITYYLFAVFLNNNYWKNFRLIMVILYNIIIYSVVFVYSCNYSGIICMYIFCTTLKILKCFQKNFVVFINTSKVINHAVEICLKLSRIEGTWRERITSAERQLKHFEGKR